MSQARDQVQDIATDDASCKIAAGTHRFADLQIGSWYETGAIKITPAHLDDFAAVTGDCFAIHMNKEAAIAAGFRDRVAHGILVMGLVDGLKNNCGVNFEAIASRAWDWSFDKPVCVGDEIKAQITLIGKRPSKTPGRGVLELDFAVLNQKDSKVQRGKNILIVKC